MNQNFNQGQSSKLATDIRRTRLQKVVYFLMNVAIASVVISICLQSCTSMSKQEMRQLVYLSPNDLVRFSQLRKQLLDDTAALRKQDREINPTSGRQEWMSTNQYHLNKIDSVKYNALFSGLKSKMTDHIMINNKGSVIFRIKQNTERHYDTYNETYSHDIISADYKGSVKEVFNMVDTVFIDSTIDKDWRYISYKVLTGH